MITAIVTALTTLFSQIPAAADAWAKSRQAKAEAELERIRAEKDLSKRIVEAELERGTSQIKATGAWFKYFSFIMWFGPFMLTWVFPSYGVQVFENLRLLPEWYVQSCMILMFAVWGISVSAPAISNVFAGLGAFFNARQKINMNRKLFYDTLRSVKGNISQYEVDMYEKAINHMVKEYKE